MLRQTLQHGVSLAGFEAVCGGRFGVGVGGIRPTPSSASPFTIFQQISRLPETPSSYIHGGTLAPMPRQRARDLPEGVFKRGDTYIYRKAIPPELRAKIGRREVFLSLGTSDELEARIRGAVELVRSERTFAEAREALLLDGVARDLGTHHGPAGAGHLHTPTLALAALTRALVAEEDAGRRAILGLLHRKLTSPPKAIVHSVAQQTLTELLDHWQEAEQPPAPELHEMQVAVRRAVKILGDMPALDVGVTALRRLADGLATVPHQARGQALNPRAREATIEQLQRLLLWQREDMRLTPEAETKKEGAADSPSS